MKQKQKKYLLIILRKKVRPEFNDDASPRHVQMIILLHSIWNIYDSGENDTCGLSLSGIMGLLENEKLIANGH